VQIVQAFVSGHAFGGAKSSTGNCSECGGSPIQADEPRLGCPWKEIISKKTKEVLIGVLEEAQRNGNCRVVASYLPGRARLQLLAELPRLDRTARKDDLCSQIPTVDNK
jgi:hypothetical protein